MQIISDTTDFLLPDCCAVAIGKFDGIHKGHRKLLSNIMSASDKEKGLLSCVFTFEPSPSVFFGGTSEGEIFTRQEKREHFEKLGLDILVEFPLNKETAAMEPEVFINELLIKQMRAKKVAAGTDISFGKFGRGNRELLEKMAAEADIETVFIDKLCYRKKEISSSRIRRAVKRGQMAAVSAMLGEPFTVSGEVIHGKALGRTLGFPTVNIVPGEGKLLPPKGVYFSLVEVLGKKYPAITNIGTKPTVSGENRLGIESNILDFEGNLYGKSISLSLLKYSRKEMKFSGIDELKAQVHRDMEEAISFFEQAK